MLLRYFNSSVKNLLNLEWSFSNIDTTWKNKTPVISTETFRMVINIWKTFLQTQSFFIFWNQKQTIFIFWGTGCTGRKLLNFKMSGKTFNSGYKSYIKLHISSARLCDLFPFKPLIPTYWHQEEPFGCSVFAEPNWLFKQHIYIFSYLTIMLQVSWHIAEGN